MKNLIKYAKYNEKDFFYVKNKEYELSRFYNLKLIGLKHDKIILKGTPLVELVSGYYEPEWDCYCPLQQWDEFKFWNNGFGYDETREKILKEQEEDDKKYWEEEEKSKNEINAQKIQK